ncbi:disulfide bond formation protein B [Polynucleobacter asymbioticus]|jgi:disulfide bond formation protein DsbB|uniref:disulfide bond formation protein B n=1 Tax=Polynucleobacter asymbioticus TaxID=576611 RepID=UPI001BFD522B|nr:disulfide bond formation protein B [Polynucleobacter asymbioticus]QWD84624.1 disulfide bond formation protein B [Polynucleobacter asymbioticus]
MSKHSFSSLPSLAALGNQLALAGIIGMLSYAFIDQFYFGELPCPLCLMQRMGFIIIGFALVLNIRCGAHSAHYGWGIIGGLVGMMVSLRQVLLHILPGDKGFGKTFLELHFYTWAYVGYVGLLAGLAILLMLPNRDVRSRSVFANLLVIAFIVLVFANLASTLLECGVGPCADDPVKYDGLIWLRSRFGL